MKTCDYESQNVWWMNGALVLFYSTLFETSSKGKSGGKWEGEEDEEGGGGEAVGSITFRTKLNSEREIPSTLISGSVIPQSRTFLQSTVNQRFLRNFDNSLIVVQKLEYCSNTGKIENSSPLPFSSLTPLPPQQKRPRLQVDIRLERAYNAALCASRTNNSFALSWLPIVRIHIPCKTTGFALMHRSPMKSFR